MRDSTNECCVSVCARLPLLTYMYIHTYIQAGVLLVCLHGCGTLSDKVVEMALDVGAPLALIPCCHTTKSWARWRERGVCVYDVFVSMGVCVSVSVCVCL
jgi:hypothetical protein